MGDDSFLALLEEAWEKIKPRIERDPDELARRLARRRQGMMRRPVRAWCLAVRASDRRINPGSAACVPEWAAYPGDCLRGVEARYGRHEVSITTRLLRRICRPVFVPKPGLSVRELAKELGCTAGNLKWAVDHGVFRTHESKGVRGKRLLVVYTAQPLDPCTPKCFEHADVLWGTTWKYLGDRVPEGIEQELVRVPVCGSFSRKDPKLVFRGWKWICPGCGQTSRVLFYPLRPVYGVKLLGRDFPDEHLDALAEPVNGFACARCHEVMYFTRVNAEAWNKLISQLSGGLLYGSEVERPGWFQWSRKRDFRPMVNREPSRRREEVRERILAGMSYNEIARDLGVSKSTVNSNARVLYKQERVKGVGEFRRKNIHRRGAEGAEKRGGELVYS